MKKKNYILFLVYHILTKQFKQSFECSAKTHHIIKGQDAVAWENERRVRVGKPIYTPEEYAERVD